MTDSPTPPPVALGEMAARHRQDPNNALWCLFCGCVWPCDAATLGAALDAAERVATFEREQHREMYERQARAVRHHTARADAAETLAQSRLDELAAIEQRFREALAAAARENERLRQELVRTAEQYHTFIHPGGRVEFSKCREKTCRRNRAALAAEPREPEPTVVVQEADIIGPKFCEQCHVSYSARLCPMCGATRRRAAGDHHEARDR